MTTDYRLNDGRPALDRARDCLDAVKREVIAVDEELRERVPTRQAVEAAADASTDVADYAAQLEHLFDAALRDADQ